MPGLLLTMSTLLNHVCIDINIELKFTNTCGVDRSQWYKSKKDKLWWSIVSWVHWYQADFTVFFIMIFFTDGIKWVCIEFWYKCDIGHSKPEETKTSTSINPIQTWCNWNIDTISPNIKTPGVSVQPIKSHLFYILWTEPMCMAHSHLHISLTHTIVIADRLWQWMYVSISKEIEWILSAQYVSVL